MTQEKLGIDVGGVIIDRVRNDGTDTSFLSDNYLNTSGVPGAFEAIRRLVVERFRERVYLVSKCGEKVQAKTLRWFQHHRFHQQTWVLEGHVRFCLERHQKAGICEELGITHFIDDRLEVLSYLKSVESRFLFQPSQHEIWRFEEYLPLVKRVESWEEVTRALLS